LFLRIKINNTFKPARYENELMGLVGKRADGFGLSLSSWPPAYPPYMIMGLQEDHGPGGQAGGWFLG